MLATLLEYTIWLTVAGITLYDSEYETFNYLMRIKLACFISFSFEAGFIKELLGNREET